ncbi:pyridoxamine 5'-phosphate oxidase family protein [Sporomusa sphaeroides]|uniref:Pyridoxamine 5'-phosphate oxidase n=1 Tax=Sporomusa sphaeroides DSM 2875 TaxID=1337886 RepID=A0ABM9W4Y9_9FIRM|nr:pyridoxamine 5'-phosphate oxidase family protein [Sporomusa sphaeroides]OLS55644.1 pyridoxamine 5'-phosphate oxidase [Sporomusa sphaeroides DSM 2875]CVK19430.1 Pyridoxamine 5'-phosphate oxidase [Sporomusa sphaeroides DSM 2875]
MQYRMKTHMLTEVAIKELLVRTAMGSLATLNDDGTPYVIPVHYLYYNGSIYVHGLPKGQKIGNIKANPCVCMTVYEMDSLRLDPEGKPCDTNTKYQSVILSGKASLVEDIEHKREVLIEIVKKYTPQLAQKALPENMVNGTAVIQIQILDITGKYYE